MIQQITTFFCRYCKKHRETVKCRVKAHDRLGDDFKGVKERCCGCGMPKRLAATDPALVTLDKQCRHCTSVRITFNPSANQVTCNACGSSWMSSGIESPRLQDLLK